MEVNKNFILFQIFKSLNCKKRSYTYTPNKKFLHFLFKIKKKILGKFSEN